MTQSNPPARGRGFAGARHSPGVAAGVTFVLGLALATLAAVWQSGHNAESAAQRFEAIAQRAADQVATRLRSYEYGLRGARGAMVAYGVDAFDREHFQRYSATRDIDREFPGARGIGIIRRVAAADATTFTAAAQGDGAPAFEIHQVTAHPGERYVIQYIEPLERNAQALGLDIASEANRRAAADHSMRSGSATLTAPITLVQATGKPLRSFLLMLPIYRPGAGVATQEARVAAAVGWAYAPLIIDEVLAALDLPRNQFDLALSDVSDGAPQPFFDSAAAAPLAGAPSRQIELLIFGRRWRADVHANLDYLQQLDQTQPQTVAAVGVTLAALLASLAYLYAQGLARTRQVRTEQSRRGAIVASSQDAIVGQTLDGRVTDWNAGAERLFGYRAEEAIGKTLASLLLPDGREAEDEDIRAAVARDRPMPPFDTTRTRRDGSLLEVSVAVSPISAPNGRCVGLSQTLRDVSEARRAQRELVDLNASLEQQVSERTALLDTARRDLQTLLDAAPSVIASWDCELRNRFGNQAFHRWFGVEPGVMVGRHLRELVGDEMFELDRPHMEAVLRGEPQGFERPIQLVDGGFSQALVQYVPDLREGRVHGFYVLLHDITEITESRTQLAAALRENDALLRTIHQFAIVSVADRAGRIVDVNPRFCEISGYARDELIGQNHRVVNSGTHEPDFWVEMWRTIAAGKPWRGVICNRAKDGSLYWVDSIIAPFLDAEGRVERYVSIRADITPAKLSEQRLRSSEAFLDRAGRIAGVGGWELDLASNQVTWSEQTYRIHELELGQRPDLDKALSFYAPQARPVIGHAVTQGIAEGTPWDLELPFVTAKGRQIWVRAVGAADFEGGRAVRLVGALQDITLRKEAEIALAYERHLMTTLLETVPDQIYFKDLDSCFLRINPGLARRYGIASPANAVGKSDADFFTAEHANRTRAVEQRIIDSGEPVLNLEEHESWPDRPPTWNLTTKMPLRDGNGRIIGTFGISRDITQRKRIEAELQQTNERFSIASDAAGIGVWEYDVASGTLTWDAQMYRLYGMAEPVARTSPYAVWARQLHPQDRDRCEREVSDALAGRGEFDTEFRIVWPDGEVRHLKAASRVVRDDLGVPLRMTGVNLDVTDRRRAAIELGETSSLLRTVLESASEVSIIATDPSLRIRVFNVGAERMLGYTRDEMIDRVTPALIHDAREVWDCATAMSASLGRPIDGDHVFTDPSVLGQPREWSYIRKDGGRVAVSLVVTAMHGEDGQLLGYLGVAHDVTLQKQAEQSLLNAMQEAHQASQAKSQFLANMSHEIRSPMNAVVGLSYLLGQTALSADQANLVDKVRLASKSLLAVINDVLDLSKIEAGELTIERTTFDLRQMLGELREVMAVHADAKGVGLSVEAATEVPKTLEGDATRLNQILTNLLSNAIKFTAAGEVQLGVQLIDQQQNAAGLRFVVRDTGIGIAPDAKARLFEPFAQADASTTRRFGGTGLGLSIVKRLVGLMGGAVTLASEPGVGSVFTVELGFDIAEPGARMESAASAPAGRGLCGVRVLVVDDSDLNVEVARRILEAEGARVSVAFDGQEAVDWLRAAPHGCDLVLMDLQMPVLDGHEATLRIRNELGLKRLPIVALTAGALTSERQRADAVGMNDFVAKPFDPQELVRSIRRHVVCEPEVAAEALAASSATTPQWPSVAGIDSADVCNRLRGDDKLFASMLARLLDEFGDLGSLSRDPSAATAQAARMHKLRGSAGTLGARRIHGIAGECEQAWRTGDFLLADRLSTQLGALLQCLRHDSEEVLQRSRADRHGPRELQDDQIKGDELKHLIRELRQQSLGALEHFEALSPRLAGRLGDEAYDQLRRQIDDLRFGEVASFLEDWQSALS